MSPPGETLRERLDLLVAGITGLRHDGGFHEPNLDGTAGDYISFDAWEWPQGVGLYGLVRLWQFTGDDGLRDMHRRLVRAPCRARPAAAQRQHHRADAGAVDAVEARRAIRAGSRCSTTGPTALIAEAPRTVGGAFQHDVSDRINDDELWDDTLFMAALFLASYGEASGRRELVDEAVAPVPASTPTISPTARPASGSTAGPSTAATISRGRAGRAAMPGSRSASST